MKKLLLLIPILLLFFACKTPAKITNSTTVHTRDNTTVNVEETRQKQEQTTTISILETVENTTVVEETTVVVYDTSQPISADTGRPPVQSESVTRRTTTTEKQATAATQVESEAAETYTFTDNSQIDKETTTVTISEVIPQKPKVAYYFYIALIVGVFVAAYFLNKKFKWISRLFR